MAMATTTSSLLCRPQPCPLPLAPSRCLHSSFPTILHASSSRTLQRRVVQVFAAAAEPAGSVPPPTPEADITPAAPPPPKPTMKKGQIVAVDKEKYLNSVEYLSVGHPPFFTGLDYIYEDRGEVLQVRFFDHGEYALIAWAGIPTSPAWLPTYMLIPADRLSYRRE